MKRWKYLRIKHFKKQIKLAFILQSARSFCNNCQKAEFFNSKFALRRV